MLSPALKQFLNQFWSGATFGDQAPITLCVAAGGHKKIVVTQQPPILGKCLIAQNVQKIQDIYESSKQLFT